MSTSKHPVLCVACMKVAETAGRALKSEKRALSLMHSNRLLAQEGEELVSVSEERQNAAEDADEVSSLQAENLRLRSLVEALRELLRRITSDKTVD